jgi:intracellular septation protein
MNPQLRRLLTDLGPLVVFFIANKIWGIFAATAVFMPLAVATLAFVWFRERRFSPMAVFNTVIVLIFGGLTLYLQDATFLKIKVTITYIILASVLLGGLAFNQLFIKYVLSFEFELPDQAWRNMTWRWAIFFLCLAGANEYVWRSYSTDSWVFFKVWIILPVVVLFAMAQTPLLFKHMKKDETPAA